MSKNNANNPKNNPLEEATSKITEAAEKIAKKATDVSAELQAEITKLSAANAKLIEQLANAEKKVAKLEEEHAKNVRDFHDKAREFSVKAQAELNKHRAALDEKLEQEKAGLKKYGSQKMLEEILEPLINIQLAVNAGSKVEGPVSNYVVGFKMLLEQINSGFEKYGVHLINPATGTHFNPVEHEAIGKVEGAAADIIVEVKKPGYKLHERVLKPAKVIISVPTKKAH